MNLEEMLPYEEDSDYHDFSLNLYNDILEYLNTHDDIEDWFHKTIFTYIFINKMTMRELSRKSNIHFNIIQKSVVRTKKKLNIFYEKRCKERE